jgi:multidrug resistance efflux pump
MNAHDQAELDTFSANVKALESNILNTQQLLRQATAELNRRQSIIDDYRRKNAEHEKMVSELREALKVGDIDTASDIVNAEFDAIHGPSE